MGDIGDYWREHREHKERKKRGGGKKRHEKKQRAPRPGHVLIFTDGGCWPNPGGCGGWGAYLILDGTDHRKELCGGEPASTNNRMELMAAIMALRALNRECEVTLLTDSKYVRNGITTWIENWKRNGWRTAAGGAVKNADLWKDLDEMRTKHKVTFKWVPGHKGIRGNEKADFLALKGRKLTEGTWEEREQA